MTVNRENNAEIKIENKSEKGLEDDRYIRVGTSYYKIVDKPDAYGNTHKIRLDWSIQNIREDYPHLHKRDILEKVRRFDGFVNIPSHKKYQETIETTSGLFYNLYAPLEHKPRKGKCDRTLAFIKHIFGEHYELGLDYLQLLYEQPHETLPCLCLVSKERGTGKSTFLKYLNALFGENSTTIRANDLRSNFNDDWAGKLIVSIDESLLDRKEDSEIIKSMSMGGKVPMEAKGKSRQSISFFGKIILCSNNIKNFVFTDNEETRYWVRYIPPVEQSQQHHTLLKSCLIPEIPAFLYFLENRKMTTKRNSRMWFTEKQIWTKDLAILKDANRNKIEVEIEEIIKEYFEEFPEEKTVCYTCKEIAELLKDRMSRKVDLWKVRDLLKDTWGIVPNKQNARYKRYIHKPYIDPNTGDEEYIQELARFKGKYCVFIKVDFIANPQ